ncbi:MAG: hypothetical protein KKI08_00860, partial [Armatimonadetes bacterium]|nr:hypothetical protein [Armatimonadota bacterium]
LKAPSPSCRSMKRQEDPAGRFCQEGDSLLAIGLDGSLPGGNGHDYATVIAPERLNALGFWLAPGDCSHLPTPGWQTLPMRHGASTIALEGFLVGGDSAAQLELDLELGGEVVLSQHLPLAALSEGPLLIHIDPPLDPGGRPLTLRLGSDLSAPFVLLTRAELME